MKFLLIGSGFIAQKHTEAIWNIDGSIVGIIEEGQDWKFAIKNTKADIISILTPNHLHYEMVKEAAKTGKVVLCEKPLVLNEKHAKKLAEYPNVYTILQLRHHPSVDRFIENKKEYNKISMKFCVPRSSDYWLDWHGDIQKSGGVPFLLGIHYFDLLLRHMGPVTKIHTKFLNRKKAYGTLKGEDYECDWLLDMTNPKDERTITINGKKLDFRQTENFHKQVYKDLTCNRGVRARDVVELIKLTSDICLDGAIR